MNPMQMLTLAVLLVVAPTLQAGAGCCQLSKIDEETAATSIRVCEPGEDGQCGVLLFEGAIALHGAEQVCASSDTVQYHEYDQLELAYGPPVYAFCDGSVVEF